MTAFGAEADAYLSAVSGKKRPIRALLIQIEFKFWGSNSLFGVAFLSNRFGIGRAVGSIFPNEILDK